MSLYVEQKIVIGWRLRMVDFLHLVKTIPAETHTESRFDPKTGQPVRPEIIVDKPEKMWWELGGVIVDIENSDEGIDRYSFQEFLEEIESQDIAKNLFTIEIHRENFESDDFTVLIGIPSKIEHEDEWSEFRFGPDLLIPTTEEVEKCHQHVIDIFNMDLGRVHICNYYSVG